MQGRLKGPAESALNTAQAELHPSAVRIITPTFRGSCIFSPTSTQVRSLTIPRISAELGRRTLASTRTAVS
jgi:hypothetical protein